ncbi:MAG: LysE family transporter, partial [Pseudomonas sp.]
MSVETWLLFSGAALIVILIPGPLSLLMISNSLNYGLRRSYPAFLGGVFASICLLSASALGLGALLLASEQLFSALKIVGALYLFYLAWQSWQQSRLPSKGAVVPDAAPVPRFRALFG